MCKVRGPRRAGVPGTCSVTRTPCPSSVDTASARAHRSAGKPCSSKKRSASASPCTCARGRSAENTRATQGGAVVPVNAKHAQIQFCQLRYPDAVAILEMGRKILRSGARVDLLLERLDGGTDLGHGPLGGSPRHVRGRRSHLLCHLCHRSHLPPSFTAAQPRWMTSSGCVSSPPALSGPLAQCSGRCHEPHSV